MADAPWDMCLVCRGDHKTRDHHPTAVEAAVAEAIASERERIAEMIESKTVIDGDGEWDSTYSAEPGVMVEPLLAWLRR